MLLPTLGLLLWLTLPVLLRIDLGLGFPYQLDAEEGFLHQQALDLERGASIYTPITTEPYLVGNYPPVYPAMVAGLLRGGGLTGLRAGRLVVAVAGALALLFLFGAARVASGRWTPALLAPLLLVVSYEFHNWAPFCRVDLPALAFTLAGILVFASASSNGGLIFSALLFVLAAYTRQTAILAPAACIVALVLSDRRELGWFLVPYLVLGLGLFGAFNTMLDGEPWRHLVLYNRNEMDWSVLPSILKNEIWFFYRWWIVAAVGSAIVAMGLNLHRDPRALRPGELSPRHRRRLDWFFPVYFLLSSLSLAAFAKSGSAPNYALEPLAATALLTAHSLGKLSQAAGAGIPGRGRWARTVLALTSIALFVHAFRIVPALWERTLPPNAQVQRLARFLDARSVGWAMFSSPNPDEAEKLRGDQAVALLREAPGDVMSELPIVAIAAGKPVLFQPFIMSRLAREGQWDETAFVAGLREGRYSVILTTQDLRDVRRGIVLARYTPAMAEAILERYELSGGLAPGSLRIPYFFWRPKSEISKPPQARR